MGNIKYKYILWDVDGTLLDFLAAEKAAIKALFKKCGFGECTDEMISEYSKINVKYWQALERGEMTKPQILVGRFREWFELRGIPVIKAESFNQDYQLALGDTVVFCDNSLEVVKDLKAKGFIQAGITNGTKRAQTKKLNLSGLGDIFDYVFISEDVGVEKPNREFFDRVISDMDILNLKEALVIGDSLTSDIKGANNAGIDCCWYNPKGKTSDNSLKIDYEIKNIGDILDILI